MATKARTVPFEAKTVLKVMNRTTVHLRSVIAAAQEQMQGTDEDQRAERAVTVLTASIAGAAALGRALRALTEPAHTGNRRLGKSGRQIADRAGEPNPLASRTSVTADEIAGERFVAHTASQEARKVVDAILRWRHGIKANVRMEIDTWTAITGCVAAGAGIAIVPEISVSDDARVGIARLEGGMPTRIYGAITRRNVRLPLSARRLLDIVHESTGAPSCTHRG